MSGANEFDDKASRLLNRLTSQPAARGEGRREVSAPTLQELGRRWEEFEQSEEESRSKMGELTQNLSKLEESLREENEGRKRMGSWGVRQTRRSRRRRGGWRAT